MMFLLHVLDIKFHKWFAPIDWEKIKSGQVAAPYIPPNNGEGVSIHQQY